MEHGSAQQSGVRRPPGGAGSGHQDVTAEGGGQRDQERGGTRGGGHAGGFGGQAPAFEVTARGVEQCGGAADGLFLGAGRGGGEHGGEFGQHGQSVVGEHRPVPDGPLSYRVRLPHGASAPSLVPCRVPIALSLPASACAAGTRHHRTRPRSAHRRRPAPERSR